MISCACLFNITSVLRPEGYETYKFGSAGSLAIARMGKGSDYMAFTFTDRTTKLRSFSLSLNVSSESCRYNFRAK